ncbi:MAG: hypothetical protein IPM54_20630 [Polyangiaceae bacterium]|nr:hypothetical protein [Polyangiaceae bacterium]
MSPFSMHKRLRQWLRCRTSAILKPNTPMGELSEAEHRTIFALLQVITNDSTLEASPYRQLIDEKTRATPGVLDAYRRAAHLLDESSHRHYRKNYSKLSMKDRDRLLHWLLIAYPHHERLPVWLRRVRISPHKLSLLAETGAIRSLRHHVMPELLSWYYTTARGWAVVGWNEFPGKARVG